MAAKSAQRQRKHHYLPATFLAGFSKDGGSRRKRSLVAGDKREGRCFRSTAENLALEKDFYAVQGEAAPMSMEDIWAGYESRLPMAIDALLDRSIDAFTWAGVLVPFATALLVRGPDFKARFDERVRSILPEGMEVPEGNANRLRSLELQRLLAPILTARWIVAEAQGGGALITNDIAFAGFRASQLNAIGLAVPLNARFVLQLIPQRKRAIATARDGIWFPNIDYWRLRPGNHHEFNAVMAMWARRFIFGHDEATVCPYVHSSESSPPPVPDPFALGFPSGRLLRIHEFTWHHLISVLAKPTDERMIFSPILDFETIAAVWKLMVVIPLTTPMYRPGLSREGDTLTAELYEVDNLNDQELRDREF